MTAAKEPDREAARLAALRQRLYRPDATEADVLAYEAELAVLALDEPDPEVVAAEAFRDRHRRPRALLLIAVPVAVAVAALATVVLVARMPSPTALESPSASASVIAEAEDPLQPVRLDPVRGTGLLSFHGRGPGIAPVDAGVIGSTGLLELIVTVREGAPVQWTAQRVEIHLDGDQYVRVLGQERRNQFAGVPVNYLLRGAPPTAIRVDVPDTVEWALVVASRD